MCEQICHPGPCEKCPLAPDSVTRCNCGQTSLGDMVNVDKRNVCTDPIPNCDQICDKLLKCGPPGKHHLLYNAHYFLYIFIIVVREWDIT